MTSFAENLEKLENVDSLARMELWGESGKVEGEIQNAPGSSGSFRVYYHLAKKWGGIGVKAAQEGLELFAEHTEDARANPGKHPNIDRLFDVVKENRMYSIRCYNK